MKLGITLKASLQQSLTPQQIQYLKMLQLPLLQLEQHVRAEIENNPMLEEGSDYEASSDATSPDIEPTIERAQSTAAEDAASAVAYASSEDGAVAPASDVPEGAADFDPKDAFEFYKLIWGEDSSSGSTTDTRGGEDDDDDEPVFQFRDVQTLEEDLLEQLRYLHVTTEERLLGEYIIGNVDDDGYLRRALSELLQENNDRFAEHNLAIHTRDMGRGKQFAQDLFDDIDVPLTPLSMKHAEGVLRKVQALDPPGIASRTVQECLIAQLRTVERPNAAQKLALMILTKTYDAFAMKHYHVIERQLGVTQDYLREAIEVIRRLTPRPGAGTIGPDVNTVTPDFTVEPTEDDQDFLITVNDSRLPVLRVSNAYEKLKKEARFHKFNKETREWLRKKYEDAKFLMQAIRQRKNTMLRVMTAIVGLQQDFFRFGPEHLKPLIYRDVSEVTGLDISTVCRIVNSKYVLTRFGTFELKYFFSEALMTDDGEEVSTRIIKQKIKELIDAESKSKPLSDDKLGKDLKKLGYNVARRTVAKYREQLRIPVARLRREL
jgi:RNA polymerase sigma-54 factor